MIWLNTSVRHGLGRKKTNCEDFKQDIDRNYDKNHLFLLRKLSRFMFAIIVTQGNLVLGLRD